MNENKEITKNIFSKPVWTSNDIGEFLQLSSRHVSERLAYVKGFPGSFRIPTINGVGRGTKRWKAKEVQLWFDRQRGH